MNDYSTHLEGNRNIPIPQYMKMNVQIHYDSTWGKEFGQTGMEYVKTHLQTWYCLSSLGTKIQLNVSIFNSNSPLNLKVTYKFLFYDIFCKFYQKYTVWSLASNCCTIVHDSAHSLYMNANIHSPHDNLLHN